MAARPQAGLSKGGAFPGADSPPEKVTFSVGCLRPPGRQPQSGASLETVHRGSCFVTTSSCVASGTLLQCTVPPSPGQEHGVGGGPRCFSELSGCRCGSTGRVVGAMHALAFVAGTIHACFNACQSPPRRREDRPQAQSLKPPREEPAFVPGAQERPCRSVFRARSRRKLPLVSRTERATGRRRSNRPIKTPGASDEGAADPGQRSRGNRVQMW